MKLSQRGFTTHLAGHIPHVTRSRCMVNDWRIPFKADFLLVHMLVDGLASNDDKLSAQKAP